MTHRLHIHRITSIGAVEEGDNPEADILFWKSRGEDVSLGSGSVLPAAASVAERLERQQRALDSISKDHKTLGREIEGMRGTHMTQDTMTAESIADTVAKKAVTMRAQPEFWDKSDAELRAELWRRTPGVRDAYTAARRDPDGFAKSASDLHAEALAILKTWNDSAARS